MYKIKKIVFFLLITLNIQFLFSQKMTLKQYIDSFKNIAMIEMIENKIPASITLAQGILESSFGNSRLSSEGNNHFGIKCKKDWKGCTILEDDDALQECFRCYPNAKESYKDHSLFLLSNKRYAALFELDIMDYKGWAKGLLAAGYATNQKYADLLIGTIERNLLANFDTLVKNGYNPYNQLMPANIEIVNRKIPNVVVQPNQNIKTIAEENNKTEKKIAKYNDLLYHKVEPGDVLYLKPKKRKSSIAQHTVEEGENMWLISQKYGIKLNSLYSKNKMEPGTEALPGAVLNMQSKASKTPDTGRIIKNVVNNAEYHIVKSGETIYSISRLYKLTTDELIKLNNIIDNNINLGQKLKVKKETISNTNITYLIHKVQTGETLYQISKKYNVSVDTIKELNNLNSDNLSIGQELKIPKP